jgi:TonB-dependent SusC/RagA subfamily outer membrane receptor
MSPSSRALLPLSALVVLAAGCAHRVPAAGDTIVVRPESSTGTTLTSAEIDRAPQESVERALQGRISGVRVTQMPDGGISVRIRGTTSINASSEPLFVLDGVAIEPGPGGSLVGINMRDIASIEVLKDATSTAMYGLRGANGVIVIRTKKPGASQ